MGLRHGYTVVHLQLPIGAKQGWRISGHVPGGAEKCRAEFQDAGAVDRDIRRRPLCSFQGLGRSAANHYRFAAIALRAEEDNFQHLRCRAGGSGV